MMYKRFYLETDPDKIHSHTRIPHWVLTKLLSYLDLKEQAVFIRIWDHTIGYNKHRWPISIKKLAKECNISEASVKRAIVSLKQKGLIDVEQIKSFNNPYKFNRYRIVGGWIEIKEKI